MIRSHIRSPRWLAEERGTAAIEYALILPVFLLCVFGIMDVARVFWTYTTLNRAVEAAARCAAINTTLCGTATQIKAKAVSEAWGLNITAGAFTSTTAACGAKVTASYPYTFFIPGVDRVTRMGTITLSASACYPL